MSASASLSALAARAAESLEQRPPPGPASASLEDLACASAEAFAAVLAPLLTDADLGNLLVALSHARHAGAREATMGWRRARSRVASAAYGRGARAIQATAPAAAPARRPDLERVVDGSAALGREGRRPALRRLVFAVDCPPGEGEDDEDEKEDEDLNSRGAGNMERDPDPDGCLPPLRRLPRGGRTRLRWPHPLGAMDPGSGGGQSAPTIDDEDLGRCVGRHPQTALLGTLAIDAPLNVTSLEPLAPLGPTLRSLSLTGPAPRLRDLRGLAALVALEELDLCGLGAGLWAVAPPAEHLLAPLSDVIARGTLKSLSLSLEWPGHSSDDNNVDDDDEEDRSSVDDDAGTQAVWMTTGTGPLRTRRRGIADALAQPGARSLLTLRLMGTSISLDDAGLARVLLSVPRLSTLALPSNRRIRLRSLRVRAALGRLAHLVLLDLRDCPRLDAAGLASALAEDRGPAGQSLAALHLDGSCSQTGSGISPLFGIDTEDAIFLPSLRILSLRHCMSPPPDAPLGAALGSALATGKWCGLSGVVEVNARPLLQSTASSHRPTPQAGCLR